MHPWIIYSNSVVFNLLCLYAYILSLFALPMLLLLTNLQHKADLKSLKKSVWAVKIYVVE